MYLLVVLNFHEGGKPTPDPKGFLLPANGETERGVKTIEGRGGLIKKTTRTT